LEDHVWLVRYRKKLIPDTGVELENVPPGLLCSVGRVSLRKTSMLGESLAPAGPMLSELQYARHELDRADVGD
jgi:hypothetical protein